MKFFYDVLSLSFLTVSAVVGAGFLSGREIAAFFGTEAFLPFIVLSFFITAAFFLLLYRTGVKEKSLAALNEKLFAFPRSVGFAVYSASFISAAGAASGIAALFNAIFPAIRFPFVSLIFILIADLVAKKGIRGVERISFFLTPFLVAIVAALILFRGKTDFSVEKVNAINCGFKTVLYVCMNCFINLPALTDGARGKGRSAHTVAAVFSAAIISLLALLIAAAIKGARTENSDTPLLFAVKNSPLFAVALSFALITSLFSAYYPLYDLGKSKGKTFGVIITTAAVFSFSLLGVKKIIDGLYPVIGIMGAVYVAKCFSHRIKRRYKKDLFVHNKDKKGENEMKKKSKNKVAKLSEEDYEKYIMSLKDERPPVAVKKAQEEN